MGERRRYQATRKEGNFPGIRVSTYVCTGIDQLLLLACRQKGGQNIARTL
jgi:hypothetical protein